MHYRAFTIAAKADGNLEFVESEQELNEDPNIAQVEAIDRADWEGTVWGYPVVCIGVELFPGLDYGWFIAGRQQRDQLESNRRDEALGELTGNIVSPPSVVR